MLYSILGPFLTYWLWARDRSTPLTRGLAFAAPFVVAGLIAYLLFGGGGDDRSSLVPDQTTNGGNIAVGTQPPDPTVIANGGAPAASDASPSPTEVVPDPNATPAPQPTAFTQLRYTVEAGDNPGVIAERVGVPVEIRDDWIEEMLALNGVTATTLQVGQELILPPF